ncbi:hypothetical protein Tco_1068011 [Tanacetum coccineum]|uniref:Uncharacterized protein n=1 Tax=Tanacetum coccineum TaxID=301880 RepID=A0ABQ5HFV2_9ASTR
MLTSTTHQQSLADFGSETRPPMLERGSYIPWESHFKRYLNRKKENKKWLNKEIDEGPYEFKNYTPLDSQTPRMQTEEVLTGDNLKNYEAKTEAMNLILISIPNEIYNTVNACSSSRTTSPYYVTHLSSVVDYDDDYQGYALQNNYEYPLTCAMILLARAITQRFSIQQIIIFVLLPTLEIEQLFKLTEYTFKAKILVMMAEIQDVHMFKRKSLSVTMFRMMLGTYRKLFELRLRELLQMFNAIIIVRKIIMLVTVQSQKFEIQRTDNQEKDEKQSQNDKTGLGMEEL